MKAHYLQIKNVISVIVVGTLVIYGIELMLQGKSSISEIIKLAQNSYPIFILTGLYLYFENYGWHHRIWFLLKIDTILKFPPDLRGRWEGVIRRDKNEHKFVYEIQQSLSSITITTYSINGNISESIIEEFTTDIKHECNFCLCFLWDGTASLKDELGKTGRFHGYSILRLVEDRGNKTLEGNYFTDRITRGDIKLKWIESKLRRSFS